MNKLLRRLFEAMLIHWIDLARKYRLLILLTVFTGAFFCLFYTVNHLSMNTDTRDMLSPDLEWRHFALTLDEKFPQYNDLILVVIEAATPDEASDAGQLLYDELSLETNLYKTVFYPSELPFLKTSALLFLDTDELQDLADNLATVQPFLARLTEDQSLRGLFAMLSEAIEAKQKGEVVDIEPIITDINNALRAIKNNHHYRLSWQRLIGGENKKKPVYRKFIILQPNLDYGGILPAKTAIEEIHRTAERLELTSANHINIRLTGNVTMSHEELLSVSKGMEISIIVAFILVALILIFGLRSVWLVLATLVTLVNGLIYTAWFAAITVGELNLISVAFAVLYIGLGVDFAIHFCLRYREHMLKGETNLEAMENTVLNIGKSLALCAVTTAIGFYAFIPTDYVGVAELGWISGSSMFISFVITLTMLPALLSYHPEVKPVKDVITNKRLLAKIYHFPATHSRQVLFVTFVLTLASVFSISKLRFDDNTLNLQPLHNPSVMTFMDLVHDPDTSPWTAITTADSEERAHTIIDRLERLTFVDKVAWLGDFIPENQEEKLDIISEIDLLLGMMTMDSIVSPPSDTERLESILLLKDTLDNFIKADNADKEYINLSEQLAHFIRIANGLEGSDRTKLLDRLETSLLASLPGRLAALKQALLAERVDMGSIPAELISRWYNDGDFRLEIYPSEDLHDNAALRRFVTGLKSELKYVSGPPVTSIEASNAVVKAFKEAFLYSLAAIAFILLFLLERKTDTIFILIPLLLAALFTTAISVLINMPLNFANIIALPLLLGIGVDSGIHITRRLRTSDIHQQPQHILANSSALAVLISALTTIVSIGNLAFSHHPGTSSMGILLAIGISMTLLCTLIILPSLLAYKPKALL